MRWRRHELWPWNLWVAQIGNMTSLTRTKSRRVRISMPAVSARFLVRSLQPSRLVITRYKCCLGKLTSANSHLSDGDYCNRWLWQSSSHLKTPSIVSIGLIACFANCKMYRAYAISEQTINNLRPKYPITNKDSVRLYQVNATYLRRLWELR
jgi:hypothetical protein